MALLPYRIDGGCSWRKHRLIAANVIPDFRRKAAQHVCIKWTNIYVVVVFISATYLALMKITLKEANR